MVWLRAFAVWLAIIAVETVHGILRGMLLVPLVGDLPARQIGVPVGSFLVFAVAYVGIRWIAARTKLQLLGVGLLWAVLTVLFEVGLGRLVLGLPWDQITEDYDPTRGRKVSVSRRRAYLKWIDTFRAGGEWLTALEVGTGKLWQASMTGEMRA
jgi:hypothetical protein